jgi:hypothetical protein
MVESEKSACFYRETTVSHIKEEAAKRLAKKKTKKAET